MTADPWDYDAEDDVVEVEVLPAKRERPAYFAPARGYSRPPFEPGNLMHLKHGTRSDRFVEPLAQQFIASVHAPGMPEYLRWPQFEAAVMAWAKAEAKVELFGQYIASMTPAEAMTPVKSGVKSPIEQYRVLDAHARILRADLGLTPMAFAKIKKDMGIADAAAEDAIAKMIRRGAEISGPQDTE